MKSCLITGATSGIGRATAEIFAAQGFRLIVCGRRTERLSELKTNLSEKTAIYTLEFDVRDRSAVEQAIDSIPGEFKPIDVLINNAGNAHGLAPIQEGDPVDWDAMIDANVKGLLYVTRAVLPQMIANQSGDIVNIGSLAGHEVYPKGNVYCASKFAVNALTQGMRQDLNGTGIRVIGIDPGLVATEFSLVRFKGDQARADQVYQHYQPLTAADVAEVIYFAISRPRHITLADILLLPTAQASATLVHKKI